MIGRPADHSAKLARGELSDPARVEELEHRAGEDVLRRRDFLGRTAALAGLAGMAGLLPSETLIAEAAKHATRAHFPRPRELPIDTFVVLMMENRSFDHYFGWHPRADAVNNGLRYPSLDGSQSFATHRLTPDFQGCAFRDPDHGWDGGRHQYDGGKLDGFYSGNDQGTGSDEYALGYYLKQDLGFLPCGRRRIPALRPLLLLDHGLDLSEPPLPARGPERRPEVETSCRRRRAGSSGRRSSTGRRRAGWKSPTTSPTFPSPPSTAPAGSTGSARRRSSTSTPGEGKLPPICFIDPPFKDGGGGNGISADEHPHGDVRLGQAFMSDVAHAFVESPQYRRGAMFINYDEWGGFFDHVSPQHVPDERGNRTDLENDWSLTGFRIPAVAISPYTRAHKRGRVSHMTCTHESILKLIAYRYGLGILNRRHAYASNIGRSFDFSKRDFDPPALPDPAAIAAVPCAVGGSGRPKPHDLTQLETSGLLDRLGYEVPKVTYDSLFRYPDRVRRAFETAGRR